MDRLPVRGQRGPRAGRDAGTTSRAPPSCRSSPPGAGSRSSSRTRCRRGSPEPRRRSRRWTRRATRTRASRPRPCRRRTAWAPPRSGETAGEGARFAAANPRGARDPGGRRRPGRGSRLAPAPSTRAPRPRSCPRAPPQAANLAEDRSAGAPPRRPSGRMWRTRQPSRRERVGDQPAVAAAPVALGAHDRRPALARQLLQPLEPRGELARRPCGRRRRETRRRASPCWRESRRGRRRPPSSLAEAARRRSRRRRASRSSEPALNCGWRRDPG